MLKVTIQKARKDYPEVGVKKGNTYYKWSFNFGPTVKSLTPPKRSQLTRKDFRGYSQDIDEYLDACEIVRKSGISLPPGRNIFRKFTIWETGWRSSRPVI
ncbi:MAG: hypothetical protein ABID54_08015 [Pseudomonadota bacterium]